MLIEQNKEWSAFEEVPAHRRFSFSEQDKDQMLGILFSHATTNKMAYEYPMAYTWLTKDIEHFVKYFRLKKSGLSGNPISFSGSVDLLVHSVGRFRSDALAHHRSG